MATQSIADAERCPKCDFELIYLVDCTECGATGVDASGEPCTSHACYTLNGEKRPCYAHCCGFKEPGKKGPYSRVVGVEYGHGHPDRYDGVSEWRCPACGYREGRWSGKALAEGEFERRFGGRR